MCAECQLSAKKRRVRYVELLQKQNGTCAVCYQTETALATTGATRRLSVDHDHHTGEIRELLCLKCNVMIGAADDDPQRLEAAAGYLRKHGRR